MNSVTVWAVGLILFAFAASFVAIRWVEGRERRIDQQD